MLPTFITDNVWLRYIIILFVGIAVGALFYPTKRIEEKTSQKYEQEISSIKQQHSKETQDLKIALDKEQKDSKSFHQESNHKISSLSSQISSLKSKQKTSHYKLVKPDGTIEERDFTESDVEQSSKTVTRIQDEFKTKVNSIENKWSKIHEERTAELKKEFNSKEQDYQKTIASLEKSKTTTVNEKHFGIEGGIMSDKDYYLHATADLFGPIFLGVQGEIKSSKSNQSLDNRLGLGIGLRF